MWTALNFNLNTRLEDVEGSVAAFRENPQIASLINERENMKTIHATVKFDTTPRRNAKYAVTYHTPDYGTAKTTNISAVAVPATPQLNDNRLASRNLSQQFETEHSSTKSIITSNNTATTTTASTASNRSVIENNNRHSFEQIDENLEQNQL
jgi:hypothetical protein